MVEFVKVTENTSINLLESKDWYAWLDTMPPAPDGFHVTGSVLLPHPGVKASLKHSVPQGFNDKILFLDLVIEELPGYWPQVLTWLTVRHDEVVEGDSYTSVEIFYAGKPVGGAKVVIVS